VATRPSPPAIRIPWVLVWYCWYWSTRTWGVNALMYSASLWHVAQSGAIAVRGGAVAAALAAPWHAAQVSPAAL
jgi:hypothetical protein